MTTSKEKRVIPLEEVISLRKFLDARVSKCNSLENEIAVAGRHQRRLMAMNAWLSNAEERDRSSVMIDFLAGDEFGSKFSSSNVQFVAQFTFHKDGTLIGRNNGFGGQLVGQLMKWSLDERNLILTSLDGAVKRIMTFDPELGCFVGQLHGEDNLQVCTWTLH